MNSSEKKEQIGFIQDIESVCSLDNISSFTNRCIVKTISEKQILNQRAKFIGNQSQSKILFY
jgi:hypothetical protein